MQNQQISISGEPLLEIYKDYYGNEVGSFTNVAPHTELRIDSTISVTTTPIIWHTDEVSTLQQWAHLQKIKYVIPLSIF